MREFGRQAKLAVLMDGALDSVDEMLRKRRTVAWLGLFGHALYYHLWTVVYPQPYESIVLRAALGAMFLIFLLPRHLILRMEAVWPAYWHLTFMLNLPFFFTYMALRNDSWLWITGLQAALLLVHLLSSGVLAAFITIIGTGLGAICAAPLGIAWQTNLVVQAWPVMFFGVVAADVLSRSQLEHSRRKTATLMSYAGYIAHEIRTPLSSIAARASLTRNDAAAVGEDRERHLAELSREVGRTFALIDILLTNVDPMRHATTCASQNGQRTGDPAAISDVITEALARYPFRNAGERGQVQVRVVEDCLVRGSPLLLQHVLMNIMRNAFEHCRAGAAVMLDITARRRGHECELSIEDNGCGFPVDDPDQTGLGLMFCRSVVRSIGGELKLAAPPSGGCTVRLCLPSAH